MIRHIWQAIIDVNDVDIEDSRASKIWECPSGETLFVRLHSHDDYREHALFDQLIGKQVWITVEVIEK